MLQSGKQRVNYGYFETSALVFDDTNVELLSGAPVVDPLITPVRISLQGHAVFLFTVDELLVRFRVVEPPRTYAEPRGKVEAVSRGHPHVFVHLT